MKELDTSWFKLKNYEKFRNMSLLELYDQLNKRQALYEVIFGEDSHSGSPKSRIDDYGLEHLIEKIRNETIFTPYFKETGSLESVFELDLQTALNLTEEVLGSELTQGDLDESTLRESIDDLIKKKVSETQDIGHRHLTVDIYASNEQIMKDFSDWLSKCRKTEERISINKVFTDKDKKSWINDRIIQYIDLKLLTAYDDMKLTDVQMGDLLLSDQEGINREAKARRTIRSKAEHLMKIETLNTLSLQLGFPPVC